MSFLNSWQMSIRLRMALRHAMKKKMAGICEIEIHRGDRPGRVEPLVNPHLPGPVRSQFLIMPAPPLPKRQAYPMLWNMDAIIWLRGSDTPPSSIWRMPDAMAPGAPLA
ncbi:MAG: hypothetical protein PUI29_08900 [Aeromonadales bacterium]|nr:hypothetical protein [Aeromonadales bacterium]MDY2891256.1 hypothetical protein [Succinivibrio sp.]